MNRTEPPDYPRIYPWRHVLAILGVAAALIAIATFCLTVTL